MRDNKNTVGSRIVSRLKEFVETLESDPDSIEKKFTCHKMELTIEIDSYDGDKVRETRNLLKTSQPVFAMLLGVSVKTVRAWEQGINVPSPMASRFMDEIRSNPKYWVERLAKSVTAKVASGESR